MSLGKSAMSSALIAAIYSKKIKMRSKVSECKQHHSIAEFEIGFQCEPVLITRRLVIIYCRFLADADWRLLWNYIVIHNPYIQHKNHITTVFREVSAN